MGIYTILQLHYNTASLGRAQHTPVPLGYVGILRHRVRDLEPLPVEGVDEPVLQLLVHDLISVVEVDAVVRVREHVHVVVIDVGQVQPILKVSFYSLLILRV